MDEPQIWQEFWNSFAKGPYDNVRLLPGNRQMLDKIASIIKPGSYVLDAGCGSGNLSIILSKNAKVKGVDFSDEMLSLAKKKSEHILGVSFEKQNVTSLMFKDSTFDAVTSVNVIFNLENPKAAILEFCRVLKSGGTLVISSPINGVQMNQELMEKVIDDCKNSGADVNKVNELLNHNKVLFSIGGMKFLPDENLMASLIEECGFIVQSTERVYYGCNVLLTAKKS